MTTKYITYYILITLSGFPFFVDSQAIISPKDISGLLVWFYADSLITRDGSNKISQWSDLSDNANNSLQASAANQPEFIDNIAILNNKPVVRFDGSNDYMQFSSVNVRTVFFVVKHANGNDLHHTLLGNPFSWHWHGGSGINLFNNYTQTANIINGSGHVNGVAVAPVSMTKPSQYSLITITTSGDHPAERITGDDPAGNNNSFWNGDFAEIIIYNSPLSSSERQQVEQYLSNKYAPPLSLGNDITVATGFCPQTVIATGNYTEFLWSTGSTGSSIIVNTSGTYSVQAKNIFGFWSYDTIGVTYPSLNEPYANTTVCQGSAFNWDTKLSKNDYIFQWQDGSTDSLFNISQPGEYYVRVTDLNSCLVNSQTITIAVDSFPQKATLGPDVSLCSGNSIALTQASDLAQEYYWSTGSTSPSLVISFSGIYSLTVTNANNCIRKDTISVFITGNAPTADFSSSTTCKNQAMYFTGISVPPPGNTIISWNWSFGDGRISSLEDPLNSYADSGSYNVTLEVTTNVNCSQTITKPVKVYALPEADFKNTGLICSGAGAFFFDSSASYQADNAINVWLWDFNDETSLEKNINVSHIFNDPGDHQVKLKVKTEKGCEDSIVKILNVKASPTVSFTWSAPCAEDPVYFLNQTAGASTYFWDFGGQTSLLASPSHTYTVAGTNSVTLTAFSSDGCQASINQALIVNEKPAVDFSYIKNCPVTATEFTDMSSVTGEAIDKWNWNFSSLGFSVTQNPSFVFPDTGNYSVTLISGSSANCYDTIVKPVKINPLPVSNFTFTPAYGDPPLSVAFSNLSSGASVYQWNFGDTGRSVLTAPVYVYLDTGRYNITLTASNTDLCSQSYSKQLFVTYEYTDVYVSDIQAVPDNDNFLKINVHVANYGNRPVNSIDFIINVDGEVLSFKESWSGVLDIAGLMNYSIKTSPLLPSGSAAAYVCVKASAPNYGQDSNPANDEACDNFNNDEFILPAPYPNPANGYLTIPFIISADEQVTAIVYNSGGREVGSYKIDALKGFNKIDIQTSAMPSGLYTYRVIYREKSLTRRYIKIAD